jgi:hypothetical protein
VDFSKRMVESELSLESGICGMADAVQVEWSGQAVDCLHRMQSVQRMRFSSSWVMLDPMTDKAKKAGLGQSENCMSSKDVWTLSQR